jgi:hypothetical protein
MWRVSAFTPRPLTTTTALLVACNGGSDDSEAHPVIPTTAASSTAAPAAAYMVRLRFNVIAANAALQSEYRLVGQTHGVPPAALVPGLAYTDRPITPD